MSNVTRTTQVPLGESLLGDVSNLDQFLGVSSSTYHFTRLSCRKTMDGVVGAGEGIKYGAVAGGNVAFRFLAPHAADLAQQLKLPDTWLKIKGSAQYSWRGIVNCSFLTWTVVKPVAAALVPLWDFVWDGVEPILVRIKDAVVDAADDALFTFQESFTEAMGPTIDGWATALEPLSRLPSNVHRAYLIAIWRPAVFFCTYPELFGNLQEPERPAVARLRWGEKCRAKLWGEWTECSTQCGGGYMARVNHCGARQVRRCKGPGVFGCDETCDSGAVADCAGRCNGAAVRDCSGRCAGGAEVGCDGDCAYPPSQEDASGGCCISPSFVFEDTGLCNTTADEATELIAESRRLKGQLGGARANWAEKSKIVGEQHTAKAARVKAKDHKQAAADANKKSGHKAGRTNKASDSDGSGGRGGGPEMVGEEQPAAGHKRPKAKATSRLSFGGRAWGAAANLGRLFLMLPLRCLWFLLRIVFSRLVVLAVILGATAVGLHHVVIHVIAKLQKDMEAEAEEAEIRSVSDRGSERSIDGSMGSKVHMVAVTLVAEAKYWMEKFQHRKKAQGKASTKAAPHEMREAKNNRAETTEGLAAAEAATAAPALKQAPARELLAPTTPAEEEFEPSKVGETDGDDDKSKQSGANHSSNLTGTALAAQGSSSAAAREGKYKRRELLDQYAARKRAIYVIVALAGNNEVGWKTRLRCFAALVRLSSSGGNRPYLIIEMGGLEEATNALLVWIKDRNLQGPDSALKLLRVLLYMPSTQLLLPRLSSVAKGGTAAALLEVLQGTPGVGSVQVNGLSAMWALIHLAGPKSGVAEGLVRTGLFEHLEDEWEDSYEDEGVAHAIGGCVMQLALGNTSMQTLLTNMGAQGLIGKIFDQHHNLEFHGRFSDLEGWLQYQPSGSEKSQD